MKLILPNGIQLEIDDIQTSSIEVSPTTIKYKDRQNQTCSINIKRASVKDTQPKLEEVPESNTQKLVRKIIQKLPRKKTLISQGAPVKYPSARTLTLTDKPLIPDAQLIILNEEIFQNLSTDSIDYNSLIWPVRIGNKFLEHGPQQRQLLPAFLHLTALKEMVNFFGCDFLVGLNSPSIDSFDYKGTRCRVLGLSLLPEDIQAMKDFGGRKLRHFPKLTEDEIPDLLLRLSSIEHLTSVYQAFEDIRSGKVEHPDRWPVSEEMLDEFL